MSSYRTKPIVIEATQWFKNGDHPEVRYYGDPDTLSDVKHSACRRTWRDHGWIDTLEGDEEVCPGDWIITGIEGEHYLCKPDIFEETYDEVGSE